MDDKILNLAINNRAKKRLENEMKDIKDFFDKSAILRGIKFKDGESFFKYGYTPYIFDENNTNIEEVEKDLINKYTKDELDKILKQLENISYLFNENI